MRYIFIFSTYLIIACSNQTAEPATDSTVHANATDTIVTDATPMVIEGCYEMTMKRDTATMQLSVRDTLITGKLNYRFYKKDWAEGFLNGVIRNDLIIADYTFNSEGMTTLREVIFRIHDNALWQGVGDLTEKNGKVVYLNRDNIQYNSIYPFVKVDCE